jgi:hypothetical protein
MDYEAMMATGMAELAQRDAHIKQLEAQLLASQMPPPANRSTNASSSSPSSSSSTALKPPPPSRFSGSGPPAQLALEARKFLQKCESYFKAKNNHNDMQRIQYAASCLEGRAEDWWFLLSNSLATPVTWQEFQHAVLAQFEPPNDKVYVQQRLRNLAHRSSLVDYVTNFELYLMQLDVDISIPAWNRMMTTDFVNGLRPELRARVLDANHGFDYSQARSLAFAHDANQALTKSAAIRSSSYQAASSSSTASRPSTYRAAVASSSTTAPMELGTAHVSKFRSPLTEQQKAERRAKGLCFYCGSSRHKLDKCPSRKSKSG